MALFEGNKRQEGTRSHTQLVKSGHMSPAEKWLLDPRYMDASLSGVFKDGVLFTYQYGGPGQEDVVIPMGRLVGVGAPVKDFVSKKHVTTVVAPAFARNNNVVGMVPYNITKDWFQFDRFGGNQPSIITLDYVKLPYIPSVEAESTMNPTGFLAEEQALSVGLKMPWGAVIGAGIGVGDYLKATPSGRLAKWNSATDSYHEVVGQILAQDFEAEPWGWFEWMMWNTAEKFSDDKLINKSGASNLPGDAGYPFDPTFKEGTLEMNGYQSQYTTQPTGVPGLHDGSGNYAGFGRKDTEYTDMTLGTVPSAAADGTLMAFQAIDFAGSPKKNLREGVVVKIDNTIVAADRVQVNYVTGQITVTLASADADKVVTATYKAEHFGTPSHLDFKGVVGEFYVLLKK